jgi:DNA repair exonuclease SbcCD ATPase subunit
MDTHDQSTPNTIPSDDTGTQPSELECFEQRLADVEQMNEQLRERITALETERAALRERVQQLEADCNERPSVEIRGSNPLADLHVNGYALGGRIKWNAERLEVLTKLLTGEDPATVDYERLPARYNPLVEGLGEARAMREKYRTDKQEFKSEFAQIRRQLTHVAEETGVELLHAIPGDDTIAKVVNDGVASVVAGRVGVTDERAEKLLQNLDSWVALRRDDHRTYATITASTAKEKLETARNESLQTTQIKRVFDRIATDWAASSPRYAKVDKNKRGQWRLRLGVSPEDDAG